MLTINSMLHYMIHLIILIIRKPYEKFKLGNFYLVNLYHSNYKYLLAYFRIAKYELKLIKHATEEHLSLPPSNLFT